MTANGLDILTQRPSFENRHLRHTAEKRKTNAAMAEAAKTTAAAAAGAGAKETSEARNFSRSKTQW